MIHSLIFLFLIFALDKSRDVNLNCSFFHPPGSKDPIPPYKTQQNETFLIMELDPSTDARCLDGTNFKFNYSFGSGSGKKKFMVFMLGGAFCGIDDGRTFLESCLLRSNTYKGTSKYIASNGSRISIDLALGFFSNIKKDNPKFWNWNKIGVNYCDGSNHQGFSREPYEYNNTKLWFRGYNNTMGTLEWARKHMGLFEAEEVIISGESAGGQAVYFWSTYLVDYFPKSVKLRGIAEAGFFIDVYNRHQGCNLFGYYMKQLAFYTKPNETDLFRGCSFRNTSEDWKCLFPEFISKDIQIPLFIINSQNDFETLRSQMAVICLVNGSGTCSESENDIIRGFRIEFLDRILEIKLLKKNWGFWLRTCIEHTYHNNIGWYSDEMKVYNAENLQQKSLRESLYLWYEQIDQPIQESNSFIDLKEWKEHCPGDFFKFG